jgi:hypothetical protein
VIPAVPLPSPRHLLALRFLGHPDGNELAAPWLRPADLGGLWLSRTAWSLAVAAGAWAMARRQVPVIALPEYICNQSLWPLRQGRAELVFYPVREGDLTPDWARMGDLTADMLVLVHYFGWPNDAQGARLWCDARGAMLVEDAAHVLMPIPGIGEAGDLVLYSPHKLLAVPDGALLVARPGAVGLERWLGDALRGLGWNHPHTTSWRIKRLLQASPVGAILARHRPGGPADFLSDPATRPMAAEPMPSPAGAALIARSDLDRVAALRAGNAATLLSGIEHGPWAPLFRIGNDIAPYRLAMRCISVEAAIALYARLRKAGVPVESWPDLPPEAGETALHLRRSLLLLPCHQSLPVDETRGAIIRALA